MRPGFVVPLGIHGGSRPNPVIRGVFALGEKSGTGARKYTGVLFEVVSGYCANWAGIKNGDTGLWLCCLRYTQVDTPTQEFCYDYKLSYAELYMPME